MKRYNKKEIDDICGIITDEISKWMGRTDLTLSEELIAETVTKIIIISLRSKLKYGE